MTENTDLLAEGRRLRAAADHEQQTIPSTDPWPATVEWFIWARNNAAVLLDAVTDVGELADTWIIEDRTSDHRDAAEELIDTLVERGVR